MVNGPKTTKNHQKNIPQQQAHLKNINSLHKGRIQLQKSCLGVDWVMFFVCFGCRDIFVFWMIFG